MPEYSQNPQKLDQLDLTAKFVLLILITLLLPFPLVILEKTILPYPAVVEEIAKGLVIFFLILNFPTFKQKILAGLLLGFLFGLSENIFYLVNIIENGNLNIFWQRMFFVAPMHIVTTLTILLPALKNKWFIVFGLAGAIILHILFNRIAAELVM
jgi:hypothetical protein